MKRLRASALALCDRVRDALDADPGLRFDLLAAAGFLLVCLGAWLVYAPAGVILVGLGLATAGILGAKVAAWRRRRPPDE